MTNTKKPRAARAGGTIVKKPRSLELASFNVNGVRSRLPHLLEWLAKEAPDVVPRAE
jgi:hypothetical protein